MGINVVVEILKSFQSSSSNAGSPRDVKPFFFSFKSHTQVSQPILEDNDVELSKLAKKNVSVVELHFKQTGTHRTVK